LAIPSPYRAALRPGRGSTWGPLLVGVTGVGLIVAGVFTTDAGAGFPPDAPADAPTMSWHRLLHEVGFGLSFGGRDRRLWGVRPALRKAWAARLGSRGRGGGRCGPRHRLG